MGKGLVMGVMPAEATKMSKRWMFYFSRPQSFGSMFAVGLIQISLLSTTMIKHLPKATWTRKSLFHLTMPRPQSISKGSQGKNSKPEIK